MAWFSWSKKNPPQKSSEDIVKEAIQKYVPDQYTRRGIGVELEPGTIGGEGTYKIIISEDCPRPLFAENLGIPQDVQIERRPNVATFKELIVPQQVLEKALAETHNITFPSRGQSH